MLSISALLTLPLSMSAPPSPTSERSPLLAAAPSGSTSSPSRPSYRQRALSRASGNPLPLNQGSAAATGGENGDALGGGGGGEGVGGRYGAVEGGHGPSIGGGDANGAADGADATESDLDPVAALHDRRRQRARRLFWRRVLAGVGLFLLVSGIVLAIVLPLTIGRRGGGKGKKGGGKERDVPDMTKLPPPKPGGRNAAWMVSGWGGGVASEEERCSRIGVDVLKENGTAVDAAIATALCVGVVNSFSSGIGGGGFLVLRPPTSPPSSSDLPRAYSPSNPLCSQPLSIDFREAAAALSFSTMFTPSSNLSSRFPDGNHALASKVGGLSVGVPGELRGFEAAYTACGGGVPWKRLFEPAAQLAREFEVGPELHRRLNSRFVDGAPTISAWMEDVEEDVYGDWRGTFMREAEDDEEGDYAFLQQGDKVRRAAYADTLALLGSHGADAFYGGPVAEALVASIQAAGGLLTLEDFAAYRAVVRPAEEGSYRGRKYYTGGYPGGGPVLRMLLNVLEGYDGEEFVDQGRTGLGEHRFIEALKFAFASRTEVGDPAHIDNAKKLAEIPTKAYAAAVRANITDDRTHPLSYYHPRYDILEDHGTTHLSVMDRWGGAVSLTTTVNLIFGSRVMDRETGIILNDEMDDFASPGTPDAFGLAPSPFNYPSPFKRPLSSTSPLIMDHPSPPSTSSSSASSDSAPSGAWLALGGSGGSRIFGAVAQTLLNLDWGHDLSAAVEAPRVHHQLLPDYVSVESTFRPDLLADLESRGHNITLFDINIGIAEVQAVMRDDKGKFFAASDSRKNGIPAAF
ncbi:hypothetical protein JCM6882_005198 [Rhodosporidiobolus microsporus]